MKGSVWSRLGSKVTCVEFLPHIGGQGKQIKNQFNFKLFSYLKKKDY
jgi:hypothetical protein